MLLSIPFGCSWGTWDPESIILEVKSQGHRCELRRELGGGIWLERSLFAIMKKSWKLSQPRGALGNVTIKCHVGSWNRKKTVG